MYQLAIRVKGTNSLSGKIGLTSDYERLDKRLSVQMRTTDHQDQRHKWSIRAKGPTGHHGKGY